MKAPINKIIEFSNVDGPGNRLAVFFQACPFNCLYCHNPETLRLCDNCGLCSFSCPQQALSYLDGKIVYDSDKCDNCDNCVHTCPNFSDPRVREYEVEEVLAVIKEYQAFIRGITVSGGEPMMYADFLSELFRHVKALSLSRLIDSNGFYDFRAYRELLDNCDGVMLDVKAYDEEFHLRLCGKSNHNTLSNLSYLKEKNKLQEVRTVLLPGEAENNRKTIAYVIDQIKDSCDYKLIRYRPQGVAKKGLAVYGGVELAEEEFQTYVAYARALGAQCLVIR